MGREPSFFGLVVKTAGPQGKYGMKDAGKVKSGLEPLVALMGAPLADSVNTGIQYRQDLCQQLIRGSFYTFYLSRSEIQRFDLFNHDETC